MPELLDSMRTGRSRDTVYHDNSLGIFPGHGARVHEAAVAAFGLDRGAGEMQNANNGQIVPAKWTGRRGLVESIDLNRIVHACAAKPVALGTVDVSIGPWIDEDLFINGAKGEAQRVRVAVAGGRTSKGTNVHGQLPGAVVQYRHTSVRK